MTTATSPEEITLTVLQRMKAAHERFACLTCYDASFAAVLDEAGVEVLLVGDSLGMVVQGERTTLPVTVEEMIYHTRCVSRARRRALVLADMPFMSDMDPRQALANAARLMKEGGAHMVKLEGGTVQLEAIRALGEHGIPVCAHLGLLPQSVHKLGGYQVQGREADAAQRILDEAEAVVAAGADMLLLECVPSELAARVVAAATVPVIGIGAGPACDAQVLVVYDMLGITPGKRPRFVKDFLAGSGSVRAAVADYVKAVKQGEFPGPEHGFK